MAILFVFQSFDRHDFVSSFKKNEEKNIHYLKRKKEKPPPGRQGARGRAGPAGSGEQQLHPLRSLPHPPALEPRFCRVRVGKVVAGPPTTLGLLVPCGAWVTSGRMAQGLESGRAHGLCCIMVKAAQVFQRRLEAELVLVLRGRGETEAPAPETQGSPSSSRVLPRACSLTHPWSLLWVLL